MDQRRVLHGSQEQYTDPKYGGLANIEDCTVFKPDGTVLTLETNEDVLEFYRSIGREPLLGEYKSAPLPDGPLPDNVYDMSKYRKK